MNSGNFTIPEMGVTGIFLFDQTTLGKIPVEKKNAGRSSFWIELILKQN